MRAASSHLIVAAGVACLLLVFSSAAHSAGRSGSGEARSADAIMGEIKNRGAKSVVAELRSSDDDWNRVISSVAKGTVDWLAVASALRSETDGGASEQLDEAIFLALGKSPLRVLTLLQQRKFGVDEVCNSNIAIDYPSREAMKLVRTRIGVLKRVNTLNVQAVRDRCLAGLHIAARELRTR